MLPGMAKTSRPCFNAKPAVINAPLRSGASTTSTPMERPEMIRLRAGKLLPSGGMPGGYSLMRTPCPDSTMRSQLAIGGRIDNVQAAGQYGDGASASIEGGGMGD